MTRARITLGYLQDLEQAELEPERNTMTVYRSPRLNINSDSEMKDLALTFVYVFDDYTKFLSPVFEYRQFLILPKLTEQSLKEVGP